MDSTGRPPRISHSSWTMTWQAVPRSWTFDSSPTVRASLSGSFPSKKEEGCRKSVFGACSSPWWFWVKMKRSCTGGVLAVTSLGRPVVTSALARWGWGWGWGIVQFLRLIPSSACRWPSLIRLSDTAMADRVICPFQKSQQEYVLVASG